MNRRGFLLGMLAAPAIVKPEILMPVKPQIIPSPRLVALYPSQQSIILISEEITREVLRLWQLSFAIPPLPEFDYRKGHFKS